MGFFTGQAPDNENPPANNKGRQVKTFHRRNGKAPITVRQNSNESDAAFARRASLARKHASS